MANVGLSFEEYSEDETNVERLNNNLELLDVTTQIHSYSDFMSCNFETQNFFEDQLQNFAKHLCSCHHSDSISKSKEIHISNINLNCRRLISKFYMLKEYLIDLHHKFDIITITETWFRSSINLSFFKLDGYHIYHLDRGNQMVVG